MGITLEWVMGEGLSYEVICELRPTDKKTANHTKSRDSHPRQRKALCVREEGAGQCGWSVVSEGGMAGGGVREGGRAFLLEDGQEKVD